MRSPIEALDLDLVFSQQAPLTVREFREACDRRGVDLLGDGAREALHRGGVLVPRYRLAKDVRAARAQARRENIPIARVLGGMSARGMISAPSATQAISTIRAPSRIDHGNPTNAGSTTSAVRPARFCIRPVSCCSSPISGVLYRIFARVARSRRDASPCG